MKFLALTFCISVPFLFPGIPFLWFWALHVEICRQIPLSHLAGYKLEPDFLIVFCIQIGNGTVAK